MAGGADWFFEDKQDAGNGYSTGQTQETQRFFRRKEVVFVITKQVKESEVDLGEGDLWKTSGSISCVIGAGRLVQRQFSGAVLICESDQTSKITEPNIQGYYLRRQVWRRVGPDEEYDPSTG